EVYVPRAEDADQRGDHLSRLAAEKMVDHRRYSAHAFFLRVSSIVWTPCSLPPPYIVHSCLMWSSSMNVTVSECMCWSSGFMLPPPSNVKRRTPGFCSPAARMRGWLPSMQ